MRYSNGRVAYSIMKAMPTLYLSYAHEDEKKVQELYDRLSVAGFKPWMVSRDVQPGAD
jgi:hypothetical protein